MFFGVGAKAMVCFVIEGVVVVCLFGIVFLVSC
jgi:hypothetical protein